MPSSRDTAPRAGSAVSYEFVPYTPRFEAEVAALQRGLWTPDVRVNARYLRWKHFENPSGVEPLIYLALADGKMVAMRGFFGSRWEAGGAAESEPIPHADDLIVAPEHRNRGVLRPLMAYALADIARRGYRFVLNLGAQPVTVMSSLADGWRRVGGVAAAGFDREPQSSRGIAALLKRARGLWRLEEALRHPRLVRPFRRLDRAARADRSPIVVSRTPRPEAMAALIASRPWDGRIRHARDAAYLAWRFRHPFHEYRFLFWEEEDGLRGYLVLQRSMSRFNDGRRVRLVDWCAADERVLRDLLTTALAWGRFARFETWTATLDDATRVLLEEAGCTALTAPGLRSLGRCLLLRSVDGTWPAVGERDPLQLESWKLRLLDAMEG